MIDEWFWIMPNKVLFNENLKDKEKLLYCYISSLCAKEWYCFATNQYIADKLNVKREWWEDRSWDTTKWTISKYISSLEKHWFIKVELIYEWKEIKDRKIYLTSLWKTIYVEKEIKEDKNKKDKKITKTFNSWELLDKYNNPIMKLLLEYLVKDYIKQSFDNDKVLELYNYIKYKTMQSHKLIDNNTWKVKIQDLCNLLETMFVYYEDKWASNIKNCFNTFYTNFHKERIQNNK